MDTGARKASSPTPFDSVFIGPAKSGTIHAPINAQNII
jgi:hypothetical protein